MKEIVDKIQENEKVITNTAKNYYFNNLQIAYEQLDVPLINNDNINKDYEIIPYVPLSYSYIFSSSITELLFISSFKSCVNNSLPFKSYFVNV